MDLVQRTAEPITVNKRGKPIAKVVAYEPPHEEWFGRLKGEMEILDDIESPIYPPEVWNALR